jgi:transposase
MNLPIRIGMDTSKSVFQLHGVDENEAVVVRRQFRRAEMIRYFERLPPVLVAIESCGSSHHWARSQFERRIGDLRVRWMILDSSQLATK